MGDNWSEYASPRLPRGSGNFVVTVQWSNQSTRRIAADNGQRITASAA
jgi:hypothetical protein